MHLTLESGFYAASVMAILFAVWDSLSARVWSITLTLLALITWMWLPVS